MLYVSLPKLVSLFVVVALGIMFGCLTGNTVVKQKCGSVDPELLSQTLTCYIDYAIATGDISVCNEFEDTVCGHYCFSPKIYCYKKVWEGRKNYTMCDVIDPSICDSRYGGSLCSKNTIRDQCYSLVGKGMNDSKICNMVGDQGFRDECYYSVAEAENFSVCDKIGKTMCVTSYGAEEGLYRDFCFYRAKKTLGVSVCEKIGEKKDRDNCYSNMSLEKVYGTIVLDGCQPG